MDNDGGITTATDSAVRPKYNGFTAFQMIREAAAPETYSWEVDLEAGQTFKSLGNQYAAVYFEDGTTEAMLITATPAHDAVGHEVPTRLTVTSENILSLAVEHTKGSYVYPIVAGPAYEVGYVTAEATLPPPPPPPGMEEEDGGPVLPISEAEAEWFVTPGNFEPYNVTGPPIVSGGNKYISIYRSQCGPSCSKWNAHVYNASVVLGKNWTYWEPGTQVHAAVTQNWKYEIYIWTTTSNCGTIGPTSVKPGTDDHLTAYAHFTAESWVGSGVGPRISPKEKNFALFDWIYPSGIQAKHLNYDWNGEPVEQICPRVAGT